MMLLLDTSAIIDFLNGTDRGRHVQLIIGTKTCAITTISINEVLIGAKGKQKPIAEAFLNSLQVLPFDTASAYQSVTVEENLKSNLIGKLDMMIAAVGLAHNLPILTCDNDFKRIQGLQTIVVENNTD